MRRIATTLLIVFFALPPASVAAEERVGSILSTATRLARELERETIPASARMAQAPSVGHDSLKNGALIGMLVGAASFGAFAAIFANVSDEACGCVGGILRFAAVGGGIGAGVGIGVDALLDRHSPSTIRPGVRLSIAF